MYKFINYANAIFALFTIFYCFTANAQNTNNEDIINKTFKNLRMESLNITGECLNIVTKISNSDKEKKRFRIQADVIFVPKDKTSIILEGNARVNFKDQIIRGNKISINNLTPEFINFLETPMEKSSL